MTYKSHSSPLLFCDSPSASRIDVHLDNSNHVLTIWPFVINFIRSSWFYVIHFCVPMRMIHTCVSCSASLWHIVVMSVFSWTSDSKLHKGNTSIMTWCLHSYSRSGPTMVICGTVKFILYGPWCFVKNLIMWPRVFCVLAFCILASLNSFHFAKQSPKDKLTKSNSLAIAADSHID